MDTALPLNAVLLQGCSVADLEKMVKTAVRAEVKDLLEAQKKDSPKMLKRKEAAAFLGVSLPTLDRYADAGLVAARHIGGRTYFNEKELLNLRK